MANLPKGKDAKLKGLKFDKNYGSQLQLKFISRWAIVYLLFV